MASFTKGPWHVSTTIGGRPIVQRGQEGGFCVRGMSEERELADAHLIAASPDLFEALLRLTAEAELDGMASRPGWDAWISQANEALLKARGEA